MSSRDIVFVTNNNDFHHEDKFDGVEYHFPPMEKVQVPIDAAEHMFGLGRQDKTESLVRLGWATHYNPETKRMEENPEGLRKLARFVFTKSVMIEAPVASRADLNPEVDELEIV